MPNHIVPVDQLLKEYRQGMPDGLDEQFFKEIGNLFARIDELERALEPFARTAKREKKFGGDVYNVNRSDCENAERMLNPKYSIQKKKKFEYPA